MSAAARARGGPPAAVAVIAEPPPRLRSTQSATASIAGGAGCAALATGAPRTRVPADPYTSAGARTCDSDLMAAAASRNVSGASRTWTAGVTPGGHGTCT